MISLALGLHSYAPAVSVRSRAAVRLAEAPAPAKREFSGESNDLIPEEPTMKDWIDNMPIAMSKSLARQILTSQAKEPEPLPEIWDWFWDAMPFLKAGKVGDAAQSANSAIKKTEAGARGAQNALAAGNKQQALGIMRDTAKDTFAAGKSLKGAAKSVMERK